MKKWFPILSSLILLAGLTLGTWWVVQTQRPPGAMTPLEAQGMDMTVMKPPRGAFPVSTEEVQPRPFLPSVAYPATFRAYNEEVLRARITGRLMETRVYPGDRVQSGQLLALIEPEEYQALAQGAAGGLQMALAEQREALSMVQEADAALQAAKARLQQTQAELDEAQQMLRVAEAELRTAQAHWNRRKLRFGQHVQKWSSGRRNRNARTPCCRKASCRNATLRLRRHASSKRVKACRQRKPLIVRNSRELSSCRQIARRCAPVSNAPNPLSKRLSGRCNLPPRASKRLRHGSSARKRKSKPSRAKHAPPSCRSPTPASWRSTRE
ncbi:hypothetical protein DCOP10_116254 [Armatimonadetes bacterium DC]|nr:hypothetical protein DCOP10_116254 [Armatimonadetes bacterium DC]